jgi:hypothetical protein
VCFRSSYERFTLETSKDLGPRDHTGPVTDVRSSPESAAVRDGETNGSGGHEPSVALKWVSIALFACTATYLAFRAAGPITDPDTWWHLRLGAEFRGGWSLSSPGRLSPFARQAWVPTQWVFEVFASLLVDAFGLAGVAWLTGVGVLVLAAALFAACRQEGSTLAASVSAMLGLLGVTASIAPRPQLVSFTLLALFTAAWLRTGRDLRLRWWLIPLTGIWACCHGMWFTGPLTGLAVVLGLALDHKLTLKQCLRLLSVPILGVCAAAITPVGPKLLLAPVAVSRAAPFIMEWQPPDFRSPAPLVTALMLMMIVMTWSRISRVCWSHILLLGLAFGWTALSLRTVAIGAVMAAPLLSAAMHTWITNRPTLPMVKRERFGVTAGLAVGAVVVTIIAPNRSVYDPPVPAEVNSALSRLPASTVVFNEYALGGWLEWKHPNLCPVIDTLADAYGPTYLTHYVDAVRLGPGWEAFLRRTGARYALLNPSSPLALELRRHWGWRLVAFSPSAELLTGTRP